MKESKKIVINNLEIRVIYILFFFFFQLMQPCDLLLVRCGWLGQLYNCSKIFKIVKSKEGFCCGFNYHSIDYK